MMHIRFMDSKQPICEMPARLDKFDTPVVVDADYYSNGTDNCRDCSAVLMTHNTKVYEDEMAYDHNFMLHRPTEDGLSPARGLMWGILLGTLMWIPILLILWAVFF